jgi:phenylalanine-4-hydroxylase
MSLSKIPPHLRKYIVEQDYSRYTPVDQAVWRFIMRQLRSYLAEHAHSCYLEGLQKTGITSEKIPHISEISTKLEKFGWQAVAVSGFIPPAAFMELQSLSILPIASDMRTLEHLLYTPAPDIVHEAAGHAPILVEPAFADYLKQYAQVAKHAIIGKRDIEQYEAIRILSDLKEHPASTHEQIAQAETQLNEITLTMGEPSEAALLSRMNWWTAEYGLIGSLNQPQIFGAGLLSSIGEAKSCLRADVEKRLLTVDCIHYSYDITERQPLLFVTPTFENLGVVLEQLAAQMAFRTGGTSALTKALKAKTVNTVQLDSGLQISGVLKSFEPHPLRPSQPAYLQMEGPTQLAFGRVQLSGHGRSRHPEGFGAPIGFLEGHIKALCDFSSEDLSRAGLRRGDRLKLKFDSGVGVEGVLTQTLFSDAGKLILLTFKDCFVRWSDKTLFDPAWGEFDMAVASAVTSVFGGPADRAGYGETEDFMTKQVPPRPPTAKEKEKYAVYARIRDLREQAAENKDVAKTSSELQLLLTQIEIQEPREWLARLEVLEVALQHPSQESWVNELKDQLEKQARSDSSIESPLREGLRLLEQSLSC